VVFERSLLRLFGEQPGRVPVDLVAWLVTGEWSSPALRCDVVFTGAGWSRLPGL
jgi:hypothetical protein